MRREAGFSLTELLVVVAIVALLLTIGVPSYRYITNSYRMSAEVNALLGDLQYARAEAIKQGQPVVVCTSINGRTCTGNNNWQRGWLVFVDVNNNGQVQPGDTVLHVQDHFTGARPDRFTPSTDLSAVSFNREGFANAPGALPAALTLVDGLSGNPAWQRCLLLTAVGTATTTTHATDPVNCPIP